MDEFKTGDLVGVRAVRRDLVARVVRVEDQIVVVSIEGTEQEVGVPAAAVYRMSGVEER